MGTATERFGVVSFGDPMVPWTSTHGFSPTVLIAPRAQQALLVLRCVEMERGNYSRYSCCSDGDYVIEPLQDFLL